MQKILPFETVGKELRNLLCFNKSFQRVPSQLLGYLFSIYWQQRKIKQCLEEFFLLSDVEGDVAL